MDYVLIMEENPLPFSKAKQMFHICKFKEGCNWENIIKIKLGPYQRSNLFLLRLRNHLTIMVVKTL